jgi:hypothetical protein
MVLHTVCQLEIDHLLAELQEKDEALVNALRELSGYRLLAYSALQCVSDLTVQVDRLRLRRSVQEPYGDLASETSQAMDTAA